MFGGAADTVLVLTATLSGRSVDTIARLTPGTPAVKVVQHADVTYFLENPLSIHEQAVLFADGWLAAVRLAPYRLEWVTPEYRKITAPPVPGRQVPVDEIQKDEAIARRWFVPGYTGRRWKSEDFAGWPRFVPAITQDALFAAPDGSLVVRRLAGSSATENSYDVFGRDGTRHLQLVLPANARILGFGALSVYVSVRDQDDLEQLERRPWP